MWEHVLKTPRQHVIPMRSLGVFNDHSDGQQSPKPEVAIPPRGQDERAGSRRREGEDGGCPLGLTGSRSLALEARSGAWRFAFPGNPERTCPERVNSRLVDRPLPLVLPVYAHDNGMIFAEEPSKLWKAQPCLLSSPPHRRVPCSDYLQSPRRLFDAGSKEERERKFSMRNTL
jgi:hypothetical protein